jgi:hypothetical protein
MWLLLNSINISFMNLFLTNMPFLVINVNDKFESGKILY